LADGMTGQHDDHGGEHFDPPAAPGQLVGVGGTAEGCPVWGCRFGAFFPTDTAAVEHLATKHTPGELAFALLRQTALIQRVLVDMPDDTFDDLSREVEMIADTSPARPAGWPGAGL
jgi:hypothetical protein